MQAHTFGQPYTLPVPLWMYAWAATAALAVSFLAAAYFAFSGGTGEAAAPRPRPELLARLRRFRLAEIGRILSVAALALTLATALFGFRDPYRNFSMTAFWIFFVLGLTYVTALLGNVYAVINPWRAMAEWIGRLWPGYLRGRLRYPARLDVWPALTLYFGFICFELLVWQRPFKLGVLLSGYTVVNFGAVWLVGAEAWFRHGEVFSVLLRLVGLLAPIEVQRTVDGAVRIASRAPLSGVLAERPARLASVLFVLFMLSSTAFDGLHATRGWSWFFWFDPTGIITALAGDKPYRLPAELHPWWQVWEGLVLLLSPFLYLACYGLAVAAGKVLARSRRSLRDLMLDFAYTLLPIAFVYHLTHYFTLVLSQGPKIISLLSDPFGRDIDLFGTRELFRAPIIPDLTLTWHVQVLLIVLGHVASVVLAHRVALRVFETRRAALLSQAPMLALMVLFTVFGLWILAQPLQATLIRG